MVAAMSAVPGVCAGDAVVYAGPGAAGTAGEGFHEILSTTMESGCCRTRDGDSSAAAVRVYTGAAGTWEPEFWGQPRGDGLRECVRRCAALHGCVGVEIGAGPSLERCELYLEAQRPAAISHSGTGDGAAAAH